MVRFAASTGFPKRALTDHIENLVVIGHRRYFADIKRMDGHTGFGGKSSGRFDAGCNVAAVEQQVKEILAY
jgi:hypothetical protein